MLLASANVLHDPPTENHILYSLVLGFSFNTIFKKCHPNINYDDNIQYIGDQGQVVEKNHMLYIK